MKRLAFVVFLLPLAALACSDDGGGERPTEGVEAEVADAVEAYFDAFTSGDAAAAHAFMSARCAEVLTEDQLAQLGTATESEYPDLAIESWNSVEVDGDTATVEYETGEDVVDDAGAVQWVNEDGWKYDGCP